MCVRCLVSDIFSLNSFQAASNFVMQCALEKCLANESGETYRFNRQFHAVKKKLETYSGSQLYKTSARLVNLEERMGRKGSP